jgi:hypothetical protein
MHIVVSACGTVTCLIGCPPGVVGSPRALVLTWLIQWLTCQPRTMYDSRVGLRYQGSRQAAVVSRMPKAAGGLWAVVDTSTSAWGTAGGVSVYGAADASSCLWVGCQWFRVMSDCGVVRGAACSVAPLSPYGVRRYIYLVRPLVLLGRLEWVWVPSTVSTAGCTEWTTALACLHGVFS